MHHPDITGPLESTSHYPQGTLLHVGFFSNSDHSLNQILTDSHDSVGVSNLLASNLMNLTPFLKHIGNDNSGATAIEYGLIIACIALALVTSLNAYADELGNLMTGNEESVTGAIEGARTPSPD